MSKSDPKTAAEWAEYSRSGHAPSLEDCFAGAMEPEMSNTIAVAASEVKQWGCPHCGFRSASCHMSGTSSLHCGECGNGFLALAPGVQKSTIGLGSSGDSESVYPELQDHPRKGTPSHGTPDKQFLGGQAREFSTPFEGDNVGELFHSRGVGSDHDCGCFVCGGSSSPNISSFVQCKDSGERIVAMFGDKGAWLDYREYEPDRVQVKVGSCHDHVKQLELLSDQSSIGGFITQFMIDGVRLMIS